MSDVIVVGTGPAGLAAITALVSRGIKPTVLCFANIPSRATLDNQQETLSAIMRREALPEIRRNKDSDRTQNGLGVKTWFGSNFSYVSEDPLLSIDKKKIGGVVSYGIGGFSRVWGATVRNYDFSKWERELRPSSEDFEAIEKLLPNTSGGFFVKGSSTLQPKTHEFSARIKVRADSHDFQFEEPRLAISSPKCLLTRGYFCGMCLQGCPTEAIFSSEQQIIELHRMGLIQLEREVLVESVSEAGSLVVIVAKQQTQMRIFQAKKVILAAGALGTPGILIKSAFFSKLVVRDSATMFSVALSRRGTPTKSTYENHGLSQWWLKQNLNSIGDGFFVQGYNPSIIHSSKIVEKLKLPRNAEPIMNPISRRMHPLISYFDMERSGSMEVSGNREKVIVTSTDDGDSQFIRQSLKQLRNFLAGAGLFLPVCLTQFGRVGEGFHSGSSVPMLSKCDGNGRLLNTENVYIADSSVLPRIDAGPITSTVMLNAHRIGRNVATKSLE